MKLKAIVHEAEDGGAEVPAIPGCATQGETFDELLGNIYETALGCLSVDRKDVVDPVMASIERDPLLYPVVHKGVLQRALTRRFPCNSFLAIEENA